jgi:hypothetical protein
MATKSWLGGSRNREVEPFRAFKDQLDTYFDAWFGRSMGGVLAPASMSPKPKRRFS